MSDKIRRLVAYCQGIYQQGDKRALYDLYLEDIESITPEELILIMNEQLKLGLSPKEILTFVDQLINVFHKSLSNFTIEPNHDLFVDMLIQENYGLKAQLEVFKGHMKNLEATEKSSLKAFINAINMYEVHFQKLENILFSQLEKYGEHFEGLKIMWALHDEIRGLIRELDKSEQTPQAMVVLLGKLYFKLYGSILKQEMILFPVAVRKINEEDFDRMYKESFEYGFCYMEVPELMATGQKVSDWMTKNIDLEVLFEILNTLPVDFTFIDDKDEVRFFNMPKDRLFPRSPSIIGRNVRNCHPPESVHVVEKILSAFKNREKSEATFWLEVGGEQVYIYYVPIFMNNNYMGTLEILQKITAIKNLKGEKRLLNWS
ncbi:MAG: DUF438 domain-containing protein [Clostridia bacterium]|nr:DUF438 domain-containing protein [Clostridia bacterium]